MTVSRGLLLVLVDPAPTLDEELNAWYDTEHLPERAVLPGFVTAMRFTSLGDGPRYAALYDLTDLGALESDAYLAVSGVNFSPWTRRVTGRAHPVRMTARQVAGPGEATGPCTRLLLLKFRQSGDGDASAIAAGLDASFAEYASHLRSRVFAGVEPGSDFILSISEFSGATIPDLAVAAFGASGARIEMAAAYRPYRG